MQKFLTIISAINDESRILILYHLLRYKELCVCDLQELLNMGQSRLSRHLKILKDAGFLYVRRQGTWAYYGINNELLKLHLDLFENIKNLELKNVIKKMKILLPKFALNIKSTLKLIQFITRLIVLAFWIKPIDFICKHFFINFYLFA